MTEPKINKRKKGNFNICTKNLLDKTATADLILLEATTVQQQDLSIPIAQIFHDTTGRLNIVGIDDDEQNLIGGTARPQSDSDFQPENVENIAAVATTSSTASGNAAEEQILISTKLCRCCLAESDELRHIFDNNNCIPDMIMAVASVQLSSNDGLPTKICTHCVLQVSRSLSFKQQIETADATLRHFLAQGFLDCNEGSESGGGGGVGGDGDVSAAGMNLQSLDETIDNNDTIDETSESRYCFVPNALIEDSDTSLQNVELTLAHQRESDSIFDDSGEHFEHNNDFQADDENNISLCNIDEEFENDNEAITESSQTEVAADAINSTITSNEKSNTDDLNISVATDEIHADKRSYLKRKTTRKCGERKPRIIKTENDDNFEDTNDWKCFTCNKTFRDKNRLNRHQKTHTIIYECATCHKAFNTLSDLNRHTDRHCRVEQILPEQLQNTFNCAECHLGFKIERDFLIHRSVHRKDGKIECEECGKEFSTAIQLKRHVRIHYEDKPHKCRICNKGFPEMGSLTRHYRRHSGEQREKKFLCNTCGKKYYDTHSLGIHTRTHTGERPWVCNTCGKGFIDSRLLHSHVKVHSDDKPFACTVCDKRFTHQSTLTTHIRTHTGEKPYICTVCGKSFIQSSNLSLHMRVHSGEKPYKCTLCVRSFASSSTLTMHMRVHTGEKPYNCKVCNRRFARHDLSAHMRTHTGEKPYQCTTCMKSFTTTGQLNQHLRTHTGEKRFSCKICKKSCSSAAYLKTHMQTHPPSNESLQTEASSKIQININDDENLLVMQSSEKDTDVPDGDSDDVVCTSVEPNEPIIILDESTYIEVDETTKLDVLLDQRSPVKNSVVNSSISASQNSAINAAVQNNQNTITLYPKLVPITDRRCYATNNTVKHVQNAAAIPKLTQLYYASTSSNIPAAPALTPIFSNSTLSLSTADLSIKENPQSESNSFHRRRQRKQNI